MLPNSSARHDGLERKPISPLRPEVIRLAIILLFTTGIGAGNFSG